MAKRKTLDEYSVSELLSLSPKVVRYFLDNRLHCTGCPMARFETAADVAKQYGLDLKEFRRELEKVTKAPPPKASRKTKSQAARRTAR